MLWTNNYCTALFFCQRKLRGWEVHKREFTHKRDTQPREFSEKSSGKKYVAFAFSRSFANVATRGPWLATVS